MNLHVKFYDDWNFNVIKKKKNRINNQVDLTPDSQ